MEKEKKRVHIQSNVYKIILVWPLGLGTANPQKKAFLETFRAPTVIEIQFFTYDTYGICSD